MFGVRPADVGDAGLRQAEVQRLALADEIADRAGDVLDRHGGIDAVLVEKVDAVGARRRSDPSTAARIDFGRLSRSAPIWRPFSILNPNLVAMVTRVAPADQRPADQRLVGERPIDLGGVEKRAAELDGAMQRRDRLLVVRRTVGLAHAHAAQSDRRDLEALLAEFPLAQGHATAILLVVRCGQKGIIRGR